jgi:hypothetical protein
MGFGLMGALDAGGGSVRVIASASLSARVSNADTLTFFVRRRFCFTKPNAVRCEGEEDEDDEEDSDESLIHTTPNAYIYICP